MNPNRHKTNYIANVKLKKEIFKGLQVVKEKAARGGLAAMEG